MRAGGFPKFFSLNVHVVRCANFAVDGVPLRANFRDPWILKNVLLEFYLVARLFILPFLPSIYFILNQLGFLTEETVSRRRLFFKIYF